MRHQTESVRGKTVLITGGARGIGAATAHALARRGASVALVGLEPELLAQTASALGSGHLWVEADVTDQGAIDAAVAATVARFGGIDVVIANAGVANLGSVHTAAADAFAHTVEVNLIGTYRTVSAAVPHLVRSKGYALLVASLASFVPMPGGAAYAASKAGVESLAASLRLELMADGVTVGSIHPSWIDTDLVRDAEEASPTFKRMRSTMPWPARSTTSAATCGEAVADAVERRVLKVCVPRGGGVLSAIRPLTMSGRGLALAARRMGNDLADLDDENLAQGATRR